MQFLTVRVFYTYPLSPSSPTYHRDYTVPANEPFPASHAWKQWQRDHTIPHAMVAHSGTAEVLQESNAPIVQLPLGYCPTKFPGYFWNAYNQKLYSLKSGVLKPLYRTRWPVRGAPFDGYRVSHLGKPRYLTHEELMQLTPSRAVIPTAPVPKKVGSRWN